MKIKFKNIFKHIVTILIVTMLFSCETNLKEVQKFNQSSFVPSGEADSINLKYADSGKIKSILKSPKMLDYSNMKNAFTEFPNGVSVTMFDNKGKTTTMVRTQT